MYFSSVRTVKKLISSSTNICSRALEGMSVQTVSPDPMGRMKATAKIMQDSKGESSKVEKVVKEKLGEAKKQENQVRINIDRILSILPHINRQKVTKLFSI